MKTAHYITDKEHFTKQNKGVPEYQGWSNSATWSFNLLFLQERVNYESLKNLIRKDGTINKGRAVRLFNQAHIQVEDWCEGYVNVAEILGEFEDGFREDS